MFSKIKGIIDGRESITVSGLQGVSLSDTLECGQCFRHVLTEKRPGYVEYMTVVGDEVIFVAQKRVGELIFLDVSDEVFENVCVPYFSLAADYGAIKDEIISLTDSEFLKSAAEEASGVRLLSQSPWETLFSFIVSQNNNIPRIRKIIKTVCAAYGRNLAKEKGFAVCPLERTFSAGACQGIDEKKCKSCGLCYSFPSPDDILENPEKLLLANPGFRYRYLVDAATRVKSREIDFDRIIAAESYEYSLSELKKITGVGDKVASCVALFSLGNLDAFPIDVWMKRAIDIYFDGNLDYKALGRYAGVAQQYIFHYIRNIENNG